MKHWFTVVVWVGLAGLSVWVVLLTRQTVALRAALEERDLALAGLVAEGGLRPGDTVGPLSLYGASGEVIGLGFDGTGGATLLFLVSDGCSACDLTLPAWEMLAGGDVYGARVVAVDAGAVGAASLRQYSALYPTYGVTPGGAGWLREIPLTPSAIAIGASGRVLGVWYGSRAASRTDEMRGVLMDAMLDAG